MTARDERLAVGACRNCLRRSWLLRELGAVLDCNCRADGRLLDLLALGDDELIAALGGRRRDELRRAHATLCRERQALARGVQTVCAHDARFPARARDEPALAALHVIGGVARLRRLSERPLVAFVGRANATDYGLAVAASLARGLAAAGVTVASGLRGGVAQSALAAASELGAPALAVVAGGVESGGPARRRVLLERIARDGCLIAELPCAAPRRRWAALGGERLLAALCDVALVVESDDAPDALAGARAAVALGRRIAAVPGRVSSRVSAGPHSLLREGARLVTGPADVIDLLGDAERQPALGECSRGDRYAGLDASLREVLRRVGAGEDTPGRLLGEREDAAALLRALGELELMGLLVRGDGGRYVARDPLAPAALR